MNIVTRFPPSPTGYFHIGSARTALFNYLFATHSGGTMYLRFEDTDVQRSKKEFENDIIEGLDWLGISYTKPEVFRQSERTAIYKKYLEQLIANGHAFVSSEESKNPEVLNRTRRDSGRVMDLRNEVIRFKNPNKTITFHDDIRGEVSFDTTDLGNFVIAKSLDEPLYHLAVVIDDHEMGVTHVIRGEDHISNTPRQILILEALGFQRPVYAHIPLILAPNRSKLSKRHGAVSVNEYRASGYLPEALINYLALLGWNPGTNQELFTLPEIVEKFSMDQVQKSGAIFDIEKLKWLNREYLSKKSDDDFEAYVKQTLTDALDAKGISADARVIRAILPVVRARIGNLDDVRTFAAEGEFDFFFKEPMLDVALIPGKKGSAADAKTHLEAVRALLMKTGAEEFASADSIKNVIWEYANEHGRAEVLWPLRYVLTGREKSPDPFTVLSIMGKEASSRRIDAAVAALQTV